MRIPASLLIAWLIGAGLAPAQVATFPQPPSLTPPADSPAEGTSNPTPSSTSADTTPPANSSAPNSNAPSSSTAAPSTAKPNPVSAATLSSMEALDDKIPLQEGDTISFRVIEDRDDAVSRVVTDTGEVDFPYIGRLKVEGKTCRQVALELKKLLEVDYYKRATVIVGLDLIPGEDKTKPKDLVWVIGEVRQEGPQELSKLQTTTVSQAILRAGGFGEYADQRKVRLVHRASLSASDANTAPDPGQPKEGEVIDVKQIFDGHPGPDPVLKPDDYIIVPKRIVNF